MRSRIAALGLLMIAGTVGLNAVTMPVRLCINRSDSLPYTLFVSLTGKKESLQKKTIVGFLHPMSKDKIAKEVVGLPGDEIAIKEDLLYLNGRVVANIQQETSKGVKLTPIAQGVIEEGYIFVLGKHELSFDSRYAEFGLVEINSICETLWPIF